MAEPTIPLIEARRLSKDFGSRQGRAVVASGGQCGLRRSSRARRWASWANRVAGNPPLDDCLSASSSLPQVRCPTAPPISIGLTPAQLRSCRRDLQIIFQDPFSSLNPRMTTGVHSLGSL